MPFHKVKTDLTGRNVKGLTNTSYADTAAWATPAVGALSDDVRSDYFRRKQAVEMYLRGDSDQSIRKTCGIGSKQVYRLITERCLQTHPDGLIYGWRGLVRNVRIRPYKRKARLLVDSFGRGAAGAMNAILDLHPDLRKAFEARILANAEPEGLGPVRRSRQSHWKWFLDALKKLGYELRNEWPFNTLTVGYSSVSRYIDVVLAANPKRGARAVGGPENAKKLITGDGVDRPVDHIFQRVEMDAHKVDGRFCVMLPQAMGGYITKIVHRLWVIVILEVFSRTVLGYRLCMGKEVSRDDVMRTIKSALSRLPLKVLYFSDVAYREGAGFPSGKSDKYVGVCWEETSVDGALAETSVHVQKVLMDVVGSRLLSPKDGFSSRRSKDDRPFIETFFRTLASRGFQKLSNTTGGNPKDKNGRNPERIAITSQFQIEYAEELIAVLIANYNATPHTTLGNRSPLEYLAFICSRPGMELHYADQTAVAGILCFGKLCTVHGGLESGRKAFVSFEGAQYSSEILGQRFDLVGKEIWVENHIEDDARIALASTRDGQHLGVLRAAPPWHKLPHSLKVRKAINSALRRRMFVVASGADAIESFLDFCEAQKNNKLPVHPAYLEARSILIQAAEQQTGQSMVEIARARHESDEVATHGKVAVDRRTETTTSTSANAVSRLPARRLARSS